MEVFEIQNRKISNKFYNNGLERAKQRDLYGATQFLKKALMFNNKNANARNLLGLIFYEEGAITDAIVQWLISRDLVKDASNIANTYIKKVQEDQDLNKYFDSIRIYNRAIDDIYDNRKDLAMMKLYKAIELNDHNVKAMALLGVLLLQLKDHVKAGGYFLKCKKISLLSFCVMKSLSSN